MRQIILDTSSIIFGISKKIDPFKAVMDEFPGAKIVLLSGVERELSGIGSSGKRNGRYAKYALKVIGKIRLKTTASQGNVDAWILKNAEPGKHVVCTNDTVLRRRLRSKGVTVLSISTSGKLR
jgi:rRNA-processing protein FCF1